MTQVNPKPLAFQVRADLFNHLAAMEKAGLPVDKGIALLRLPGAGQVRLEIPRKRSGQNAPISTAPLLAKTASVVRAGKAFLPSTTC